MRRVVRRQRAQNRPWRHSSHLLAEHGRGVIHAAAIMPFRRRPSVATKPDQRQRVGQCLSQILVIGTSADANESRVQIRLGRLSVGARCAVENPLQVALIWANEWSHERLDLRVRLRAIIRTPGFLRRVHDEHVGRPDGNATPVIAEPVREDVPAINPFKPISICVVLVECIHQLPDRPVQIVGVVAIATTGQPHLEQRGGQPAQRSVYLLSCAVLLLIQYFLNNALLE